MRPPLPDWDLGLMGAEELRSLIGRAEEFRPQFPSQRSRQWMNVMLHMASIRLRILEASPRLQRFVPQWQRDFERMYETLPARCQWRRRFNVLATVPAGKKFRKHPPRVKENA